MPSRKTTRGIGRQVVIHQLDAWPRVERGLEEKKDYKLAEKRGKRRLSAQQTNKVNLIQPVWIQWIRQSAYAAEAELRKAHQLSEPWIKLSAGYASRALNWISIKYFGVLSWILIPLDLKRELQSAFVVLLWTSPIWTIVFPRLVTLILYIAVAIWTPIVILSGWRICFPVARAVILTSRSWMVVMAIFAFYGSLHVLLMTDRDEIPYPPPIDLALQYYNEPDEYEHPEYYMPRHYDLSL